MNDAAERVIQIFKQSIWTGETGHNYHEALEELASSLIR